MRRQDEMDHDDELRMLRARAYGPRADIALDGAALQRLRELEDAAASRHPEAPEPVLHAAAETGTETAVPDAAPTPDTATAPEPEPPHPPRRVIYRRVLAALVIVVALLASAGIGAAVQARTTSQLDSTGQGELVAVVDVDPDFSWPSFFPEPGSLRAIGFRDLAGITVVAIPPSSAAARGWCIFTYETARIDTRSDSYIGDSEQACDARPFPASVVIDLARAPSSLREAYPDTDALRLELDSESRQVLVFAGRIAP